ncbi:hypothetical protein JTE90_001943 [Oedothorax gibbosus]|uniref:Uncharacterized protein n=1 Tax=Oedothorax gibbosus TaxID=931172 RepID=A0AAV6VW98_9ARAC|nr:hypothetical protein JTE90_001943 [Oedothorax gibbosus]
MHKIDLAASLFSSPSIAIPSNLQPEHQRSERVIAEEEHFQWQVRNHSVLISNRMLCNHPLSHGCVIRGPFIFFCRYKEQEDAQGGPALCLDVPSRWV